MFEIGNTLREARVRRNLTLQQVEEDTKIRVKYVQAMENEDFDVMPGATYVKGFLRTYSDVSRPRPRRHRRRVSLARHAQPARSRSPSAASPCSARRAAIAAATPSCSSPSSAFSCSASSGPRPAAATTAATPTKPGALGIAQPVAVAERVARAAKPQHDRAHPAGRRTLRQHRGRGRRLLGRGRARTATGTVLFSGTLEQGRDARCSTARSCGCASALPPACARGRRQEAQARRATSARGPVDFIAGRVAELERQG